MKVVLIDDNPTSLAQVEMALSKLKGIQSMESFLDPNEAKTFITANEVDTVLLETEFAKDSGLDMTAHIQQVKPEVMVSFVSTNEQYAVEAYELNISDYLIKPVMESRLKKTLKRMKDAHRLHNNNSIKPLDIQLCNRFEFIRENKYEALVWQTKKSEELFLYLLHHNTEVLSKQTLLRTLWPNEKASTMRFNKTIAQVKEVLGKFHNHFELIESNQGYQLQLAHVYVDMWQWREELSKLPPISDTSINDYERVMRKNAGVYLNCYPFDWLTEDQEALEAAWTSVALKIAQYYFDKKIYGIALPWYRTICARRPGDETAFLALMKVYELQGNESQIARCYKELQLTLLKKHAIAPSEAIRNWYKAWEARHICV